MPLRVMNHLSCQPAAPRMGIRLRFKRWLKKRYNRINGDWNAGRPDELAFWDRWLHTHGLDWPEEYQKRIDRHTLLAAEQQALLEHLPQRDIKILDVGAGPLTALGKKHPTKRLIIVPTDALASEYDALLEKHHIVPPVRTIAVDAERLRTFFPANSFDMVYARNSIDHCYHPFAAIQQMVALLKPGCFLLLEHAENEAETQLYSGLHQWNFTIDRRGDFLIKSTTHMHNISRELAWCGNITCQRKQNAVLLRIQKAATPSEQVSDGETP